MNSSSTAVVAVGGWQEQLSPKISTKALETCSSSHGSWAMGRSFVTVLSSCVPLRQISDKPYASGNWLASDCGLVLLFIDFGSSEESELTPSIELRNVEATSRENMADDGNFGMSLNAFSRARHFERLSF